MQSTEELLERGIELFRGLIGETPALRAAFEASAREYFGSSAPGDEASADGRGARRRHLEWFLFERSGAAGSARVADELLPAWRERAGQVLVEVEDGLLNSHAGIFELVEARPGRPGLLRDLAGLGEYAVDEGELSQVLEVGDLVVGRLFPLGGAHRISPGAGVFRNAELLQAIGRDLERLREERRHPVLRVPQPELEAMFWGKRAPPVAVDALGHALRFLVTSGLDEEDARELLLELCAAPFRRESLLPGIDDPLGRALDRLAFETDADLERARVLLLAAWTQADREERDAEVETEPEPLEPAHAQRAGPSPVREALAEFERDRARGLDLERSFEKLEQSLGVGEDPDSESEGPEWVPDFPGVVAAVIEEYLWETEHFSGRAAARELEPLRALGACSAELGVLEELGARHLLSFAGLWLPEHGELRSPAEAERALAALRGFLGWVETAQSLELLRGFGPHLERLERSLPRVVAANLELEGRRGGGGPEGAGRWAELLAVDEQGIARVREHRGPEFTLSVGPGPAKSLEPGDQLRLATRAGSTVLLRVFPPEVRELLGGGARESGGEA